MQTTTDLTRDDVDQLNSFLRGELSAVETYSQAIDKLSDKPAITNTLQQCQASHRKRADEISGLVRSLGGTPADSSGAWGTFAKLVEGGAKMFGEGAAISVLEEGEDHGLNDYRRDLDDLSPAVRNYVQKSILPEQRMTHDRLSKLQDVV